MNDRDDRENGKENGENGGPRHNIVDFTKIRGVLDKSRQAATAGNPAAEPMINLPPATKLLLAVFIFIHIFIVAALDAEGRYDVYQTFGFIPGYYTGMMDPYGWERLYGPLTYAFLHGSWIHLFMNGAMLMAFGAAFEKRAGGRRMLALFFLCSLAAAAVHFVFNLHSDSPVIGASGGLSGLFAATIALMRDDPRLGFGGRRGLWSFAALWVGLSILFGIGGGPEGAAIAWQAHIGGFAAGFLLLGPVMRFVP